MKVLPWEQMFKTQTPFPTTMFQPHTTQFEKLQGQKSTPKKLFLKETIVVIMDLMLTKKGESRNRNQKGEGQTFLRGAADVLMGPISNPYAAHDGGCKSVAAEALERPF